VIAYQIARTTDPVTIAYLQSLANSLGCP